MIIEVKARPPIVEARPQLTIDVDLANRPVEAGLHHALPHLRLGKLMLLMPGLHDTGKREIVVHYAHRQYLPPRVRVVVDGLLGQFGAARQLPTC